MPTPAKQFAAGLNLRREMFGAAATDQSIKDATDFTQPMQEFVTRFCFGEIWNRPHLDRRTRSMLTLAIVCSLGKPNQLKVHVRGAIANGVTKDEIREVLMHTMIYAGVPAAVDAFSYASETLTELGLE